MYHPISPCKTLCRSIQTENLGRLCVRDKRIDAEAVQSSPLSNHALALYSALILEQKIVLIFTWDTYLWLTHQHEGLEHHNASPNCRVYKLNIGNWDLKSTVATPSKTFSAKALPHSPSIYTKSPFGTKGISRYYKGKLSQAWTTMIMVMLINATCPHQFHTYTTNRLP